MSKSVDRDRIHLMFTELDAKKKIVCYTHWLFCPGCLDTHVVRSAHPEGSNTGPIWEYDGNLHRPTFSPSIRVGAVQWPEEYGPARKAENRRLQHPHIAPGESTICHSFLKAGKWEFLTDSTHVLAGQTVNMIQLPDYFFKE